MKTKDAPVTLHLQEPVRVTVGRDVVPIRRKGLALLAYVALEGPARREAVADALWDGPRARQNLRVELHRLREALSEQGIDPVTRTGDCLVLATAIRVAPVGAGTELLAGLEDVSPAYQAWIEYRRSREPVQATQEPRWELLEELARQVVPPFVLVVQGPPGSGRHTLARDLARRLALPFVHGVAGPPRALHYIAPDATQTEGIAAAIRADDRGVWVIGHSVFDEDPPLLLHLRADLEPERMRFERLGPLPWTAAKRMLPADVGFGEGARLYLASCGNPGYLRELLRLRSQGRTDRVVPIPQRIRAAYALESHRLGVAARHALERLAAHGGPLSAGAIEALGAQDHVDELERMGWLGFDGTEWSMVDALAARLLSDSLPEAERRDLKRKVAARLAHARAPTAPPRRPQDPARRTVVGNARSMEAARLPRVPLPLVRLVAGSERLLDEPRIEEGEARVVDGRVAWSRLCPEDRTVRVAVTLPRTRLLLRIVGRVAWGPSGESADAATFRLATSGDGSREATLCSDAEASVTPDGKLRVPTTDAFEHWFFVEHGRTLWLESSAPSLVAEVGIAAFHVVAASADHPASIQAIDLAATLADAVARGHDAPPNGRPLSRPT